MSASAVWRIQSGMACSERRIDQAIEGHRFLSWQARSDNPARPKISFSPNCCHI